MRDYSYQFERETGIYYLYNTAGGGHDSTRKGLKKKCNTLNPTCIQKKVDTLKDTLPRFIGNGLTQVWDRAKCTSNVQLAKDIVHKKILWISCQLWGEILLFLPIFIGTFVRLVFNPKITRIIDVQPVGIKGVVASVLTMNGLHKVLRRKKIRITRVLTELPTKDASNYANPAKWLWSWEKKVIEHISTQPIPKRENESDYIYNERQERWWQANFGLSYLNGEVKYGPLPLREAFEQYRNLPRQNHHVTLKIRTQQAEEIDKIRSTAPSLHPESPSSPYLSVNVEPHDIVGFITIGSKAAQTGTLAYVREKIKITQLLGNPQKKYYLFIGCGKHTPGTESLFEKVHQCASTPALPANLEIIPMTFQSDKEYAPLMHRADYNNLGGGGLTQMEAHDVATGAILTHSESESCNNYSDILSGLVNWEAGNGEYQIYTKNGRIITPDLFISALIYTGIFQLPPTDASPAIAEIRRKFNIQRCLLDSQLIEARRHLEDSIPGPMRHPHPEPAVSTIP